MLAPIVLFVYKRLNHTKKVIESLQRNIHAKDSELYIYSDAAQNGNEIPLINEVRNYVKSIEGFKSVNIIERQENLGLSNSIISGVTEIVNKFGKVIVLEDDLFLSPFFLQYMNDALNYYEKENKVISIHGYCYPTKVKMPATFFLRGADCWGWATWKRGWDNFEPDTSKLINEIKKYKLEYAFDLNGTANNMRMLRKQLYGKIDSWAIRWHASAFLNDKLTLYPGISLVQNIGMDDEATHTKFTNVFDTKLSLEPIAISSIKVEENQAAVVAFRNFFFSIKQNFASRVFGKLKRIF